MKDKITKSESRNIFIWDIHWCFDELILLIKKLKLTPKDKVYLVWDMINKWPKSYEVISFIYEKSNQFKVVMWNHELLFLDFLDGKLPHWEYKKYLELKEKLENQNNLLNFIRNLPLYIEQKDFILLHWGILPWKKLSEHTAVEITNLTKYKWKAWYLYYTNSKKIIYWHWEANWLKIRDNTIWLDSWCVRGNELTAYILETWEIIQQKALRQYVNPFIN